MHNLLDYIEIIERVGKQNLRTLRIQREDASVHILCSNREQVSNYTYNWNIIATLHKCTRSTHTNTHRYLLCRRWVVSLHPPPSVPPTQKSLLL